MVFCFSAAAGARPKMLKFKFKAGAVMQSDTRFESSSLSVFCKALEYN